MNVLIAVQVIGNTTLKMKTLIVLMLAVIVAQGAVLQNQARANLNVGYVSPGDRLLHRSNVVRGAISGAMQTQDVTYRGNITTRIAAVQALEVGATQWANAWIVAGGIGWSNVTIRFQTSLGRGYNYQMSIWGR